MGAVAREATRPGQPIGCTLSLALTHSSPAAESIRISLAKRRNRSRMVLQARLERGIADGELAPDTNAVALARFFDDGHSRDDRPGPGWREPPGAGFNCPVRSSGNPARRRLTGRLSAVLVGVELLWSRYLREANQPRAISERGEDLVEGRARAQGGGGLACRPAGSSRRCPRACPGRRAVRRRSSSRSR